MEVARILAEIDAQIDKLQQARSILSGVPHETGKRSAGRPRQSVATSAKSAPAAKKTRNLSPEARKRIADAQKRRWAERRQSV